MKVALFGGSFNPPHIGHLMIARQVVDFCPVDEVWWLPSFGQRPPKDVAPVEHRLAMVRLLELPKTKVSTIEIDNTLDGETVHILPFLPKGNEYSFIMGSDQVSGFDQWLGWEELLDVMHFWIFPRYGYEHESLRKNMTLVSDPTLMATDISSTKVRERIKAGLPIDSFVPPAVAAYIQKHKLYLQ